MSRFMDTDIWEGWEERGRPEPPQSARAKALELLESHQPPRRGPPSRFRIREVIAEHVRDRRGARAMHPRPAEPVDDEVLTQDELEGVHAATLRVLERTGVQVRLGGRPARGLGEAGAKVDEATMTARFPSAMVEECMALVPTTFLMAARDPALDLPIDGSADGSRATGRRRSSSTTRPAWRALLDPRTDRDDACRRRRRRARLPVADGRAGRRAAAHAGGAHHARDARAVLKHAQHNETYSRRDARAVLEMARVVAGGDRELRERPIVSTYQCCISPLVYDAGPIEAAIEFARGGLPSGFISMGIGCATAPATLAGTLVSMNAEMVGGMTIVEALVPGAVTFCGPYPTFMDLRTGGYRQDWGRRTRC